MSTDIPHLELGHALITMIEPEPATIAEYNEWYERDHSLSGVLTGPGAFSMRRFVATRDLKALRGPADSPIGEGSFIALYWFERGQFEAHTDWGFPETARLFGLGRMRSDRQHQSTSYYELVGVTGRGPKPVPVELTLQHPYESFVMVWTSAADGHEDAAAAMRTALTADGSTVGNVVTFREAPLAPPLSPMPGAIIGESAVDPATLLAHCCFVNGPADATLVDQVNGAVATAGLTPVLVAPFVPTIPGTDTYLDQLW